MDFVGIRATLNQQLSGFNVENSASSRSYPNYLEPARRFLAECVAGGELRLGDVRAADVVRFVQREAARLHHSTRAKLMTTALRSFLQFARYRDLIRIDLRSSVPTVANWSMASLPRGLSADDVQRLLAHCVRTRRSAAATGQYCCCSPAWACVPVKWLP
ncbi:MAG: site-specific integrase [Rhodocyclaceae bacterium]|nr:site-specific integrase [Rhodocyclaceae bacterium]